MAFGAMSLMSILEIPFWHFCQLFVPILAAATYPNRRRLPLRAVVSIPEPSRPVRPEGLMKETIGPNAHMGGNCRPNPFKVRHGRDPAGSHLCMCTSNCADCAVKLFLFFHFACVHFKFLIQKT